MKNHIAVIELNTEEESVLTLYQILRENRFTVSLFLSKRIWDLIGSYLRDDGLKNVHVYDDARGFSEIYAEVANYLSQHSADLVVLPRFYARHKDDLVCYLKLARDQHLCVGIVHYPRWSATWPPILVAGFPYVSMAQFQDWFFCRAMVDKIHCFFGSEIERDSRNPLKLALQKKTERPVFDCPFKLPEGCFAPSFDYEFPRFIIPGKIQRKRRDYASVLDYFARKQVIGKRWELVLLGKPDGLYGRYVTNCAQKINLAAGVEKVKCFDHYVSKEEFDREMHKATHILAPLNPKGYQMGKDSGAIYDVFKYNKIGIFDSHYFSNSCSVVRKGVICYDDYSSFYRLMDEILANCFDYHALKRAVFELDTYMGRGNYVRYVGKEVRAAIAVHGR